MLEKTADTARHCELVKMQTSSAMDVAGWGTQQKQPQPIAGSRRYCAHHQANIMACSNGASHEEIGKRLHLR